MRSVLLASILLASLALAACAPAPMPGAQQPAVTEAVRDILSPPSGIAAPAPTAAPTPIPFTHLDLWLTAKDDPTAPPVNQLTARSVSTLYIWAIAAPGITGDFTLQAMLQDGTKKQLGAALHAAPLGAIIRCGSLTGIFLSTKGIVQVQAYAGGVLLGSVQLSIN